MMVVNPPQVYPIELMLQKCNNYQNLGGKIDEDQSHYFVRP